MCFTGYRLNWNPWIWIPFPVDSECTLLCAQVDRTRYSTSDKICMMMTRLACNRAIESSYWRMDNDSDVGLLTGYVLYRLPVELEFMDLDTFPR